MKSWACTQSARAVARVLVLALTLLGTFSGCAERAAPAAESPVIRLGTYEWPGSYWIDVAWQKGWFAEAGLTVERIDTDKRYFAALEDVATGKLDGMGFTQFDLVRHVAAGHDLVGIAAIDYSDGAEALIARPGIKRLSDLRGKRLALHRGTYLEYLLARLAQRDRVDLNDITLIDRSGDDAVLDITAGRVDAVFVWEPYAGEAQQAVDGVRLFSTAEIPSLTYSVFSMRREFIDEHPVEVQKLMDVWQRTVQFIREHPHESTLLVAKSFDESVADIRQLMVRDRILDAADNGRAFSYGAGFESLHGSWRRMNDFMIERSLVARRVDSSEHLDSRFVRALD
jgi:NitT/TauT family transport system substrate-binding protein